MIAPKKIKLTSRKISAWLAIIIFLLTAIILTLVTTFLYKNFYETITQTKVILVLKEKVAMDTVNMNKFNSIIDKLTKKTSAKELGDIVSPFR